MQIADRIGVRGAVDTLVHAHGPAGHPVTGLGDHRGGQPQIRLTDAGDLGDPGRWIVGQKRRHPLPALGVLGDELPVDVTAFDEQVQQSVQQREVGAGLDLQVQVGLVGRGRAARVDDDELGARLEPVRHPQVQDRVTVGHVGPDDEEQVREVEVLVGPGRPV